MRPSSIVFLNDFCIRYIQSERESLVTHGASECKGNYDSTTQIGWGAGYVNNCVHSGTNSGLITDTVWYNYAAASAGIITSKSTNDAIGNLNTATESVCPKGWSLPTTSQINSNKDTANFRPVKGGGYYSGALHDESAYGIWWGAEAYNDVMRWFLIYNGSILYSNNYYRYTGLYIRCVSEEKTVTDLTYMQDMTRGIKEQ